MSESICPQCGDGPNAIGTLNHIECVERCNQRIAELEQKYEAMLSLHNDEMHKREQAEAHLDAVYAENQRREDVLHKKLKQAEAEVAQRDRMLDLLAGAMATAVWDGLEYRQHLPKKLTIQAPGPLLRSYYANPASVRPDMTKAAILADLRARAEEGPTP